MWLPSSWLNQITLHVVELGSVVEHTACHLLRTTKTFAGQTNLQPESYFFNMFICDAIKQNESEVENISNFIF